MSYVLPSRRQGRRSRPSRRSSAPRARRRFRRSARDIRKFTEPRRWQTEVSRVRKPSERAARMSHACKISSNSVAAGLGTCVPFVSRDSSIAPQPSLLSSFPSAVLGPAPSTGSNPVGDALVFTLRSQHQHALRLEYVLVLLLAAVAWLTIRKVSRVKGVEYPH